MLRREGADKKLQKEKPTIAASTQSQQKRSEGGEGGLDTPGDVQRSRGEKYGVGGGKKRYRSRIGPTAQFKVWGRAENQPRTKVTNIEPFGLSNNEQKED